MRQILDISLKGSKLDYLHVFYMIEGEPTLYKADYENGKAVIVADSFSFFRLYVMGGYQSENLLYVAQTDFCLFGNAKQKVDRRPVNNVTNLPPRIELVSPKRNYWPQTGQLHSFSCNFPQKVKELYLGVVENGKMHDLTYDDKLFFTYMPPHDKALRNSGVSAGRHDVILARYEGDGYSSRHTYTMRLHRSRTAFHRRDLGVLVFLLSIGVFCLWVVGKRRLAKSAW